MAQEYRTLLRAWLKSKGIHPAAVIAALERYDQLSAEGHPPTDAELYKWADELDDTFVTDRKAPVQYETQEHHHHEHHTHELHEHHSTHEMRATGWMAAAAFLGAVIGQHEEDLWALAVTLFQWLQAAFDAARDLLRSVW